MDVLSATGGHIRERYRFHQREDSSSSSSSSDNGSWSKIPQLLGVNSLHFSSAWSFGNRQATFADFLLFKGPQERIGSSLLEQLTRSSNKMVFIDCCSAASKKIDFHHHNHCYSVYSSKDPLLRHIMLQFGSNQLEFSSIILAFSRHGNVLENYAKEYLEKHSNHHHHHHHSSYGTILIDCY